MQCAARELTEQGYIHEHSLPRTPGATTHTPITRPARVTGRMADNTAEDRRNVAPAIMAAQDTRGESSPHGWERSEEKERAIAANPNDGTGKSESTRYQRGIRPMPLSSTPDLTRSPKVLARTSVWSRGGHPVGRKRLDRRHPTP